MSWKPAMLSLNGLKGLTLTTHRGVLVKNHGPFSWGTSPANAVYNAKVMEQCAKMAFVSFYGKPRNHNESAAHREAL